MTMDFIIQFIFTVCAVLVGILLAEFFKPVIKRALSNRVKEIQRSVGIRPKIEFGSPSKRAEEKQFLNAIAPEHE